MTFKKHAQNPRGCPKVMDGYAEFTQVHVGVPWRSMRNMRNRMAHGLF